MFEPATLAPVGDPAAPITETSPVPPPVQVTVSGEARGIGFAMVNSLVQVKSPGRLTAAEKLPTPAPPVPASVYVPCTRVGLPLLGTTEPSPLEYKVAL